MARIIFEYDRFNANNESIKGIYTRQLDLSSMAEILNDSPETLVNALIHLSTISKSQFQAHATVCDDFRNANPERYKKIMDYSMHVSIFNERGDTKPKRNPVMSKQDLLQALRTLKHI